MWSMRAMGAKALTDWVPHKGSTLWDCLSNSHIALICLRGDVVYFDYMSWCGKVMVIKRISKSRVEHSTPVNKLTRCFPRCSTKDFFLLAIRCLTHKFTHANRCTHTVPFKCLSVNSQNTRTYTLTINTWQCCVVDHQVSLMSKECNTVQLNRHY